MTIEGRQRIQELNDEILRLRNAAVLQKSPIKNL